MPVQGFEQRVGLGFGRVEPAHKARQGFAAAIKLNAVRLGPLYSHDSEPATLRANATTGPERSHEREGGSIVMADSKDFTAGIDSNAKKSPRRIVFITRRTSAQVKADTEDQLQAFRRCCSARPSRS